MAYYRTESDKQPPEPSKTGALIVNLGTPVAPTTQALRAYLKEFLSDPRIVEMPQILWQPILRGFILPKRPQQSAKKYAKIWREAGSPLKIHTELQAKLLAGYLYHDGYRDLKITWAMRYGEPSIAARIDQLKAEGCLRILVIPLYPQYAASTTASIIDDVATYLLHCRNLPEIRYVRSFADHPDYIDALAKKIRKFWQDNGQGEKLIMSFHGLPQRAVDLGDPYHRECSKTAETLARALSLPPERWQMTFQSRFGKAKWLQPYTQPTLEKLPAQGVRHIDVVCPGFVSDCLETLEEIAIECKAAFLKQGGETFHYIPCLNDDSNWINALKNITSHYLAGWAETPKKDIDPGS